MSVLSGASAVTVQSALGRRRGISAGIKPAAVPARALKAVGPSPAPLQMPAVMPQIIPASGRVISRVAARAVVPEEGLTVTLTPGMIRSANAPPEAVSSTGAPVRVPVRQAADIAHPEHAADDSGRIWTIKIPCPRQETTVASCVIADLIKETVTVGNLRLAQNYGKISEFTKEMFVRIKKMPYLCRRNGQGNPV